MVFPLKEKGIRRLGLFSPVCYEIYLQKDNKRVIVEVKTSTRLLIKAQVISFYASESFQGIEGVYKLEEKYKPYAPLFYNSITNCSGITISQEEFPNKMKEIFEFLLL